MAISQIIDVNELEEDLTSIADTLRLKKYSLNLLNFPTEFIEKINDSYKDIDWFDANKPVGPIYSTTSYIELGTLTKRKKITKVFAPNATYIDATALENSSVTELICPKCVIIYTTSCGNCTNLTVVDLGGSPSSSQGLIRATSFSGCSKLKTLILRATNRVWPFTNNINVFANTPFASGKSGGTLYVPRNLIESYKAATNWSTILAYTKSDGETLQNQILPIEDSEYYTHYGDGTLLPDVYESSTGKLYRPIMNINMNSKTIEAVMEEYGTMEYLEELTLTGACKMIIDNTCILQTNRSLNHPGVFHLDSYPSLRKISIQPTEIKDGNGNTVGQEDTNYNKFSFGHYAFYNTNLNELILGRVDGPYFTTGGYFSGSMPCPPGTTTTQIGSLNGLTITVYTDQYSATAGFMDTIASNTTIICKDYLTGEILTSPTE